jgi:sulfoxide reductase heme-binding subunit YedZ
MMRKLAAPFRDPAGRFSALKTGCLLFCLLPAALVLQQALAGTLGPRPITEAIHQVGDWTVRLLLLTLAVTPARALLDWPLVVQLRRMLGVATACYASLHITLYAMDQQWNLWTVASEIALRFYLTIGFVALLGLLALAITSTDGWQKHLRGRWKKLHRLVFPIAVLGLFHYFIQSKIDVTSATFYAGLFFWLMLWRALPRRWRTRPLALPGLAIAAGLATAAVEALWYGLATKVPPLLVLAANLDLSRWRPAWQVAAAGLAVLIVVLVRRRMAGKGRFFEKKRAKSFTRPATVE